MERNKNESNFRYGTLPGASAPLAIAYVPMQTSAAPAYEAAEALSRGTLFPGLDLPFMNIVNERYARREQLQLAQGSMAVGISEQNGGLSYVCI